MSIPMWCLLTLAVSAQDQSRWEVGTLDGRTVVGTVLKLSSTEIVVKTPDQDQSINATDLLMVRNAGASNSDVPPSNVVSLELMLVDSSRLQITGLTVAGSSALVKHPLLGELKIPVGVCKSVRFASADSAVESAWKQLLERPSKKDQVAVRKGDVLDHLDGVLGSLDESTIKFQLDGDEIPVKREKAFGLIWARPEKSAVKGNASIELSTDDVLSTKSVSFDGEVWQVKLASGLDLSLKPPMVRSIDFSTGKIAYLSNLEPREVKYTPYFDYEWEYRRDRMVHGQPISLGNKTYAKGLGLHSKTLLKYRLGGDYRRFQAILGIDDSIRVAGDVDISIKGDGRVLFESPISVYSRDDLKKNSTSPRPVAPQPIDLDVSGVVELEILVDFGEFADIGDCLNMADAKVVK